MGCHEDREMAPANHVPQAIVKAKPWPVLTPPGERRVVDFGRDISGILERRCAACHRGESPAGGMEILVQDTEQRQKCYEVLRARSVPGRARESELVLRLLGRNPAGAACALEEHGEKKAFVEWVDLGLPWQQREVKLSGGMNSHDLRP